MIRTRAVRVAAAGLLLLGILLLAMPALAQQPDTETMASIPMNPHYFYGVATSNGIPVPEGIVVEAKVGGVTRGSTTVGAEDGKYLFLRVPFEDGVAPGQQVEFYVHGEKAELYDVAADETLDSYTLVVGGLTELDLEAEIRFIVTVTATFGGEVEPSGEVAVVYMDDETFTMTPLDDFAIADVLLDGESVLADVDVDPDTGVGTYTLEDVAADHTLHVVFKYTKMLMPLMFG